MLCYGMDRLLVGGDLSTLRVNKCGVFSSIAVAFLLFGTEAVVAEKGSPFQNFHSGQGEQAGSIRGTGQFPSDSSFSTSSEISSLYEENAFIGVVQNVSCRVFQLRAVAEDQNWPKLQLGWRSVLAVILGGIGAALSSAGGLGGGGLFVPLFNLLLQFDAKTSAVLSNFMILGGSVANLYINLRQHHPTAYHKPLIDFDVVLLFQPNMLLGISTGVILNVILPEWVITALLTLTLSYIVIHSFKGGLRRWKKETNQNRQRRIVAAQAQAGTCGAAFIPYVPAPDFHHHSSGAEDSSSDDDGDILAGTDHISIVAAGKDDNDEEHNRESPNSTLSTKHHNSNNVAEEEAEAAQPLLGSKESTEESSNKGALFPVDKILALGFTWLAFFVIQVLRGSSGNGSILGLKPCGFGYWVLTLSQIPLALSITHWTVKRLRASHAATYSLGGDGPEVAVPVQPPQEDCFVLTPTSCTLLSWMALVAGLLGGLLGIGGGMIVNPLLLTVGMIPQVTAGTCASMVFFSSSMSVVQYWLMGRVPLDWALSAAVLCAIFSCMGVVLVHRAIDKYNRASIIVFSVTAVMGVSAILMGGLGGFEVWRKYMAGDYMGFHNFC